MRDDGPSKQLKERTGKHYCVRCLAEVPADVYLANDHICAECAEGDEYPPAGPPPVTDRVGRKKDDRRRK